MPANVGGGACLAACARKHPRETWWFPTLQRAVIVIYIARLRNGAACYRENYRKGIGHGEERSRKKEEEKEASNSRETNHHHHLLSLETKSRADRACFTGSNMSPS